MVAALQGDYVEAAGVVTPVGLLLQEQAGGEHQPFLLAPVDTAEGATEARVQPVADFDEYYCIAVEHDQIELAAAAAPVLRQQAQAVLLQVVAGQCLGRATTVLAAVN